MDPAPGMEVDHINGDIFDNRRANLEVVTAQENKRRRKRGWVVATGGSRVPGIRYSPTLGAWMLSCRQGGQNYALASLHPSEEEAMRAKFGVLTPEILRAYETPEWSRRWAEGKALTGDKVAP